MPVSTPVSRTTVTPAIGLNRVSGLDGLRAVAIVAVIVWHVNLTTGPAFPNGRWSRIFAEIAGTGWIGVDLFFVLSGFLITRILFAAKGQRHYFRNFYIRRVLRIFPLYYLYAGAVVFVLPRITDFAGSAYWIHPLPWDRASVFFYFYNFRLAVLRHDLPLVPHLWSLAVEEHFYFVWPVVVGIFNRRTLMRIALTGLVCSFIIRLVILYSPVWVVAAYLETPCRLDGLLLGGYVALAQTDSLAWAGTVRLARYGFGASTVLLTIIAVYQGHFYCFVSAGDFPGIHSSKPVLLFGISALAVLFASILVYVVESGLHTRWLSHPAIRQVGIYSYGIYIYHWLVLKCAEDAFDGVRSGFHIPDIASKLVLSVVVLAATTLIA